MAESLLVHIRLPKRQRLEGLGLHVWGPAAAVETKWEEPLAPLAEDWYGLTFEVPLAFAEKEGKLAMGLILHLDDLKKCSVELGWEALAAYADELGDGELWIGHAEQPSTRAPERTQLLEGDLHSLGARGHWVSPSLILWRTAASLPEKCEVTLHASASAQLSEANLAGQQFILEPVMVDEDEAKVFQENPYLQGCGCLRLPQEAVKCVGELCKQQLALCLRDANGEVLDCTGVQIGMLLDHCFRYDGALGCDVTKDGVQFHLWAPSAVSVELLLYDGPRKGTASVQSMSENQGVPQISELGRWVGKYYNYKVQAYHPSTGRIETMETPDPYCLACSADAGRSMICELPPCPQQPPLPPFSHRADAAIYELHVRDFSAKDDSVAAKKRGSYLAFEEEGTVGDRHLRRLADSGISHVHLLPTFDFGSVPERCEERLEAEMPSPSEGKAGPDSEGQQMAVMEVAVPRPRHVPHGSSRYTRRRTPDGRHLEETDQDAFNWGYDPVLFGVPEGSYASDPDGLARVLEHRRMVTGLHRKGLRVVADVVFNHVFGSGPVGPHSVLDKCVPGYYLRRSEDGKVENSTCMNNTATERYMMERHVVDMLKRWVKEQRVDGFRFDLMGMHPEPSLCESRKCRQALDEFSLEEHGVDGPRLLLYGEGWEFGEIAQGARGVTAVQRSLAGTGVGSFNDGLRGAALGGNAFEDPRIQGGEGRIDRRPCCVELRRFAQKQMELLRIAADNIRLCMAGGLKDYKLEQDCFGRRALPAGQLHGGHAAYVSAPEEAVNFICVHDNETLYDSTAARHRSGRAASFERVRANWLCTAILALGHGVPLFHAGDEVLRSKSLDRDSYNSGDWFNWLDFTGKRSGFGRGLPPWGKNHTKWELMKPLLRDQTLAPTPQMAQKTTEKFCELLRIRRSTPLLGLWKAKDIHEKVKFPVDVPGEISAMVVMEVCNGPPADGSSAEPLCDKYARVVVVLSALPTERETPTKLTEHRVEIPASYTNGSLQVHPLHAESTDELTREARVDLESNELLVPPMSAIVFVEPEEVLPTGDGRAGRLKFKPAVRDRPIRGNGLGLLESDPATVPFRGHLEYRWKVYTDLRKSIQETAGSLTQFAEGYQRLGFTTDESGAITYREWLPPAQSVQLGTVFWFGLEDQLDDTPLLVPLDATLEPDVSLSLEPGLPASVPLPAPAASEVPKCKWWPWVRKLEMDLLLGDFCWSDHLGLDPRRTVMMIRNIPARCQDRELTAIIQEADDETGELPVFRCFDERFAATSEFRLQMPRRPGNGKCKGYVPRLQIAPALLVDHVIALEQITAHSDVLQDQALAGSLLVLLYARCRFGDGQRATDLLLDIAQDASGQTTGFIELSIRRHKTATSIERKRRILPVVAPIFSLSSIAWHDAWVRAREQLGLCTEGQLSAPLCPAFDREGAPLPNGSTSGEGSELLRGLLRAHLGTEVPHYTSHSLKTTLLSWAAKFGLDLASRRILGYHLAPGAKTAETYARDCMAAPLRQLLGVLEAIRAGSFQPDVTRSGMFSVAASPGGPTAAASATGHQAASETEEESAEECLDQIDELSECCSCGSAEAPVDLDDDTELLKLLPAKARPKFLQAAAGKRIFRHKYSGLSHIQKEDGTALECGKLLTDNFVEVEAAFCHRMTELENDNSQQKGLLDQGLNSFAKLAFAASNQPGQIDETKFGKLVTTCFAADSVTLGLESQMRRLIFEAITHTVQSIADRTRDPIAGEDMKMPPQERDRRLADQRLRLGGLLIRHATEPAHGLVDKFVKMVHDSCLKYIPLPGCVSREDELCNERTSKKLLHLEHNQLAFVVLRRAEDMPRLVKQFWGRDLPRRGIGAWEPVEPGIPFKIHPAKAQPMDPVPLEEWCQLSGVDLFGDGLGDAF
ncbi:Pullulanase 1 [Durusdinium trenchii]|uniref:Chloroplastic (AtPU1) (Protein LIMIT DEXTRINASE) (AtLDA) n=1 Tax=Durusdinium trenchii TaxID=1381693 RepID=A0ABP0L1C0_9DINO